MCFNPRRPCGRRRSANLPLGVVPDVSIRAALAGGDNLLLYLNPLVKCFNPRRPCGRRPPLRCSRWLPSQFQSAPPLRAATGKLIVHKVFSEVSIRAALAGGDHEYPLCSSRGDCFNPRRPCGRRLKNSTLHQNNTMFQSAPPLRAATLLFCVRRDIGAFQSAPPLRAATLRWRVAWSAELVSIRAALAGGDAGFDLMGNVGMVSIRAALAGGDYNTRSAEIKTMSFNPRRPCGRRLEMGRRGFRSSLFQSAPPLRAATTYRAL